ncbi:MAG: polyprenol monophosphomannose synthase [Candidatus Peribacteraceae bacterium]|nr:polyprenol monophosphomannose synthase [Candidatus Peribacteraceae bacterium]
MTSRLVSLLLPTYNEAENIGPLIEAIDATVTVPHEILVVDDDSPDGTWQRVEEIARTNPRVRLERRRADRGLTKSLQHGIDLAQEDVVVWMDCDFSMPPAVIPELLSKIAEGYDIAVGSRFVAGGKQKTSAETSKDSPFAIVLSTMGGWIMRLLLFPSFHDYTSGFIAVRREVLQRIRLHGDYGEYFIDLIVRAKLLKFRIAEIPYVCAERRAGMSKTAPTAPLLLRRCAQYGRQIVRMEWIRLKHLFGATISDN